MISTRHVPQTLPTPEDTMALGPRESVATARILIVDDNRYECETMQAILAGSGHTVKATDTGFEALRWLEEQPYDLLICALKMPKLDGPLLYSEVLSRWRTNAPKTFFVSGLGETSAYSQELKALDVPVLFKPFAPPDLLQMVARVLQTV